MAVEVSYGVVTGTRIIDGQEVLVSIKEKHIFFQMGANSGYQEIRDMVFENPKKYVLWKERRFSASGDTVKVLRAA